jgi:hypothetical protein
MEGINQVPSSFIRAVARGVTMMSSSDGSIPGEAAKQPDSTSTKPAPTRNNRRLHERIPNNSDIMICCQDKKGVDRRIRARAINTSKAGILVQSEESIPAGTVVCLQSANLIIIGKACVRYSTPKGLKFRLGLYVPDRFTRTL